MLVLIQGLLPLASLYLIKLLIDSVTEGLTAPNSADALAAVVWFVVLLGLVAVISTACSTLSTLVNGAQGQAVSDHMTSILHAKSIEIDLEYYENSQFYNTLHRAQQSATSRPTQILHTFLQLAQNGISLVAVDILDLTIELDRMIQAVNNHAGDHTVTGRELFVRPPYRIEEDAQILKRLQAATPQSKLVGLPFWADSALAGAKGTPSILFGPVGHGAHAIDEWVSLKSLINVYEIIKKLILAF